MKTRKYLFILTSLLLFIVALPVHSTAPVWKIEKDGRQVIIGGTIHLLTPSDYPLPQAFEDAYKQSKHLIFESDMQKIQDPEFQLTMLRELIYADGRNLRNILSEATYLALETYCTQRGIPMAIITSFKPGMAALTLSMMELQRLGIMGTGVDAFFSSRAIQDNKRLGQLETAEQQLSFLSSMGEGQEDEIIVHTLRDIEELPAIWKSLRAAWRKGDLHRLQDIALTPLKKDFPHTYNTMLVKRNNAWLPQIEALFKTEEATFILVGALHLVGDDGLLEQLAAKGYKVERF